MKRRVEVEYLTAMKARLIEDGEKKGLKLTRPILLTSPSDHCPLGECDGSGFIVIRAFDKHNSNPYDFCIPCRCLSGTREEEYKYNSNIPKTYENSSINDFNISYYKDKDIAKKVKMAAKSFVLNFQKFQETGKGLYLYSKTKGSGKTYLACAIGNALITQHNIRVKFISTIELLELIKDCYKSNSDMSEKEVLNTFKTIPVLILDDIGAENKTAWVDNIFLNILDYRISNCLVTLFTSNVTIEKLALDERIVNRLYKMAIEIQLPEESVRKNLARIQNMAYEGLLNG